MIPAVHVFFDLAFPEATGALHKYERTLPWRCVNRCCQGIETDGEELGYYNA